MEIKGFELLGTTGYWLVEKHNMCLRTKISKDLWIAATLWCLVASLLTLATGIEPAFLSYVRTHNLAALKALATFASYSEMCASIR